MIKELKMKNNELKYEVKNLKAKCVYHGNKLNVLMMEVTKCIEAYVY
jgi:hypothetical protein